MSETWATKMGLAINDPGKEKSVEEMMHQRIGDYESFLEFQGLVFGATEEFVDGIDPTTFSDVIVAYPYGATVARPSRRASALRRESRAVTRSNVGSTSTPYATWARSNTLAPWSGWAV